MTEPKRAPRTEQPLIVAALPQAMLTIKTASLVSGLSVATLYRKAAEGCFPLTKIGRRCTRIRCADLTTWLDSHAKK